MRPDHINSMINQAGAQLNHFDHIGYSQEATFLDAIHSGEIKKVMYCLERNPEWINGEFCGISPLTRALIFKQLKMAMFIATHPNWDLSKEERKLSNGETVSITAEELFNIAKECCKMSTNEKDALQAALHKQQLQ